MRVVGRVKVNADYRYRRVLDLGDAPAELLYYERLTAALDLPLRAAADSQPALNRSQSPMLSSPFIIPLIAIIGGLSVGAFSMWLKHREKMGIAMAQDASLRDEIRSLKARVATLETIVTDGKEQLKREIDSL